MGRLVAVKAPEKADEKPDRKGTGFSEPQKANLRALAAWLTDEKNPARVTQAELAGRIGVDPASVNRFLKGQGINPEAAIRLVEQVCGHDFVLFVTTGKKVDKVASVSHLESFRAARAELEAGKYTERQIEHAAAVLAVAGAKSVSESLLIDALRLVRAAADAPDEATRPLARLIGDTAKLSGAFKREEPRKRAKGDR